MLSQNTAQVKRNNENMIKAAIRILGIATKKDIAKMTGLSFATCSNLVNEMVASNELLVYSETKPGESGRPSYAYMLNPEFKLILILFIEQLDGIKNLKYAVTDLTGETIEEHTKTCSAIDFSAVHDLIYDMKARYSRIGVIGISVQGVIVPDGRIALCDTKELEGMNLIKKLESDFDMDVVCENDMNILAYGIAEDSELCTDGSAAVIARYKNIPSGAGLVHEGRIIHGTTNFAGEISFLSKGKNEMDGLLLEILGIITVMNPGIIAITGSSALNERLPLIRKKISEIIPRGHLPELLYLDHAYEYAKNGLVQLALKKLDGEL